MSNSFGLFKLMWLGSSFLVFVYNTVFVLLIYFIETILHYITQFYCE